MIRIKLTYAEIKKIIKENCKQEASNERLIR